MRGLEVEKDMNKSQNSFNKFLKENKHPTRNYKSVAIGYLSIEEEYQKGPVSQDFINKLRQVWSIGGVCGSMGHHDCEFCINEGNYKNKATSSCEKIIIDKKNNIQYKFPQMIFHYIEKHGYQPPEDFVLFILTKQNHGKVTNG